ncbi:MAG: class I mannose-6-phosphate isomerase [Acidobacteria bacterium]|nr:class I mannose-6-phosphate isomerase [Acidobacteriota bacterium]
MSRLPSRFPEQTPANSCSYPLKLEPFFQERVWGRKDLSYLYDSPPALPHPVGEVWLTADSNRVANGAWKGSTLGELCRSCGLELLGRQIHNSRSQSPQAFPLLVKFLFTTEKLSVQVHPPDSYARKREGSDGKTEMWHVLQAEAGARLAVGFREELRANQGLDRKALQAAIESGDIEEMLYWREVGEGETFYVPAGTIHTIGAGLILCEIQQNSDITYRLYDYKRPGNDGQPRTLHVEKGLEVLQTRTPGGRTSPLERRWEQGELQCLVACPYFATEKLVLEGTCRRSTEDRFEIWIGLEGEAAFEAGGERVKCGKGEVIVMPAAARTFSVAPASRCVFLRSFQPDLEADVRAPLRAQGFSEQQLQGMCFPEPPTFSGEMP